MPCIRYADDIALLARSERASQRLLESSTKYLEGTLKLKVNREKSRTVSVFATSNFKYLGFCFGKNGKGIYIRVHPKSWKKVKDKLRGLTSRSHCGSIVNALKAIRVYMRGWLGYYSIASMKTNIENINGWLYSRIRMCIRFLHTLLDLKQPSASGDTLAFEGGSNGKADSLIRPALIRDNEVCVQRI